jgi:single-strand DNA-binding protein
MNKVILIGRITADPELNFTASQMAVTKFTIAVDRHSKDKGADFVRVTAFGNRAENICRYMRKGRQIAVEGRIQTGSYTGKDGKTVYTTDVIIDNDEFLGSGASRDVDTDKIVQDATNLFGMSQSDDGIPF